MKERPILFSAPMVVALLAGAKTQTRRLAKFQFKDGQNPDFSGYTPGPYFTGVPHHGFVLRSRGAGSCWNDRTEPLKSPYGYAGDRLWVRENFVTFKEKDWIGYPADARMLRWKNGDVVERDAMLQVPKKTPSIYMRRWMSRLLLEVTDVRIERLHDISARDAVEEGLTPVPAGECGTYWGWPGSKANYPDPREAYREGWKSINGADSWDPNPWVWVVTFKRVAFA